jgi:hypothetical protein
MLSPRDAFELRKCEQEATKIVLEKKRKRLKDKTAMLDWTDQKEVDHLKYSLAYKRGLKHKL